MKWTKKWGRDKTIMSGTKVTPFGYQGSYIDSTGLIYLINRYYDPTTDQFLSIDPDVAQTNQPYVYTGDDPLNSTDPLGLTLASAAQALANALVELAIRVATAASNPTAANLAAVTALDKRVGSDTSAVKAAATPPTATQTSTTSKVPVKASSSAPSQTSVPTTQQAVNDYIAASTLSELSPNDHRKINGACAASFVIGGSLGAVGGAETLSAGREALSGAADLTTGLIGGVLSGVGVIVMYGSAVALYNAFGNLCRE